ncbi:MAG: DNA photolyase family protein [Verrucomicrobiae bacterium]|nr:DNA photolyase family protein [Verrucomicrobiae bacterium]
MSATLVWFRLDLRWEDQPALHAAALRGRPVIPVFIWAPEEEGAWPPGGASRWWLHQSLRALDAGLRRLGSRLILQRGPSLDTLQALRQQTGADAVFWNRRYEPALIARDKTIKETLRAQGVQVESYNAALLFEPWTIHNRSGAPFQVFTPFWKHCLSQPAPAAPLPAPTALPAPKTWPVSLPLEALELEPKIDWAAGMRAAWQPGPEGAAMQLERFLAGAFARYAEGRNLPGAAGTSRLSPHLHFGEIGPRQIWQRLRQWAEAQKPPQAGWASSPFVAELGWREFAYHLLYHFPHTPTEPLRPAFKHFPWRPEADATLRAWQKGRTGYPIVDAGMRELWATGWMHNRVRMIAGSFLVKDLLLDWRHGARWFWDTLVDADLASNTLGWQWVAGCGADAAPYFRVFNPVTQGEKFDPHGDYVRRWVPELARMPDQWIHHPWEAPPDVLAAAGVHLGDTYPRPIVNHTIAREVALEAFKRLPAAGG